MIHERPHWSKIQLIITRYSRKISEYGTLLQRALFSGPRRIIGKEYNTKNLIQKIKNFVGRISPSLRILGGSVIFLLYALLGGTKNNNQVTTHNVASQPIQNTQIIEQETINNNAVLITADDNTDANTDHSVEDNIINDTIAIQPEEDEQEANDTDPYSTVIYNMYQAINDGSYVVADFFDSYMQTSELIQNYFTRTKMLTLASRISDISVDDITISETDRENRMQVRYSISYQLDDQSFDETWEVILRPEGETRKIGTVRCDTRGCGSNPFFDPDRYGIR